MSAQPEDTNEPGEVEDRDGWLPPLETLSNDELLGELHDLLWELRDRLANYIGMGKDDQDALDDGLLLATKTSNTINSHRYGFTPDVSPTLEVAERILKEDASYKTLTSKSSARGGERG